MRIPSCCPFPSFSRLLCCKTQSNHQSNARIRLKELNSSKNKNNHPDYGQFLNAELSGDKEKLILFFEKDSTVTKIERYVDDLGVFHEEAPSKKANFHSVSKKYAQLSVHELIGEFEHTGSTNATRSWSKNSVLLYERSTSIELPAMIPPLKKSASSEDIIQI